MTEPLIWKGDDPHNELTEALLDGWDHLVSDGFFGTPRQHCEKMADALMPSIEWVVKNAKEALLLELSAACEAAKDPEPMGPHGESMNSTMRWVQNKIDKEIEKLGAET